MKTKYLIKFLNNTAHLDADLEFVDVLQNAVRDGKLKTDVSEHIFDNVDKSKHTKLASRANTEHSRLLTVNHLKSSIRAAFIKGIYETASTYFHDVLKAVTRKGINTDRLLGEHTKTFTCKEIVELGNYPNILEAIATSIFRQLENERSTKNLLEKMSKKLGLAINSKKMSDALPFFEIRHKLVHADGKVDKEFCTKYTNIIAEPGKQIRLSYKIIREARETITALIREFDKQIVEGNLVSNSELQP